MSSQLSRLQDDVNWLNQAMKTMQTDASRFRATPSDRTLNGMSSALVPSPSQSSTAMSRPDLPQSKVGAFKGPTSMAYSLDVANTTISNMGYRGLDESDREQSVPVATSAPPASVVGFDPLLEFDKDEMVRLCQFHEDETGIMYPVLNIHAVIAHAKHIAPFLESARAQGRPAELFNDEKTLQLKMTMCCALVVESHGNSDKATRLYESMEAVVNRKLMSDAADVGTLPLLCLLAGYRFLANEEVIAWRVIGQVVRLCVELGIHQKAGLMNIKDETRRKNALMSFWSSYVLDRRWSFGTGLPFTLQDDEIDQSLPIPVSLLGMKHKA